MAPLGHPRSLQSGPECIKERPGRRAVGMSFFSSILDALAVAEWANALAIIGFMLLDGLVAQAEVPPPVDPRRRLRTG